MAISRVFKSCAFAVCSNLSDNELQYIFLKFAVIPDYENRYNSELDGSKGQKAELNLLYLHRLQTAKIELSKVAIDLGFSATNSLDGIAPQIVNRYKSMFN